MKKIIIVIITTIFIGIYAVSVCDTNSVIIDFENCIKDTVLSNDVKDSELYKFYCRTDTYHENVSDANVKVRRLITLHNFKRGVMIVNYDCEAFNDNHKHIYGSSNVYAKWEIEKKNGRWIVVDIKEQP